MANQPRCEVCGTNRQTPGNEWCKAKLRKGQRLCDRCQERANTLALENDADFEQGVGMARDEYSESLKVRAEGERQDRLHRQAKRDYEQA